MDKAFDRRLAALEARAPSGDAGRSFVIWPDDEPQRFHIDGQTVGELEWHDRVARRAPRAHVIRVERNRQTGGSNND